MSETAETSLIGPTGVGRALVEAREARGLSIADVAQQLRLARRQVEALEAEEFDRLPGKTFTRGFVRNYARLLGLDADGMLERLEKALPEAPPVRILPETQDIPFPSGGASGLRRYGVLLVLLLLAMGLLLFESLREGASRLTGGEPAVTTVPVPAVPVEKAAPAMVVEPAAPPVAAKFEASGAPLEEERALLPAAPAAKSGDAPAPQRELPVGARPEPASSPKQNAGAAPKPGTGAAAKPAPPTEAGRATLRLRFEGESWVEVRDGQGQRVLSQVNSPGSERVVRAAPPVSLVIGNASQVSLEFNGEAVDLVPHSRSDVARLTLP